MMMEFFPVTPETIKFECESISPIEYELECPFCGKRFFGIGITDSNTTDYSCLCGGSWTVKQID